MPFTFPRVYPILDASIIPPTGRAEFLHRLGVSLADVGATLLEYRNKTGADSEILADCAALRAAMPAPQIKLILDDRADLVSQAAFDGVHVDAGDLSPEAARQILGPDRIIGTFGGPLEGTASLLPGILFALADYLAIGPIFPTITKQTSKPPIGPDGVRRLRQQAGPTPVLVAVGGVTFATAPAILAAGATTIAASAAIFRADDPAEELRRWLKELA